MMPLSRSARVLVSIAVVLLGAVVLLYAFQETSLPTRLIVGVALALIAAWFVYSLWVDRRYARLLEDEVANQTRSLMSSLSATASAERNLRLLMEAVPDAITVLDRDGRVLDANPAGRTLVPALAGSEG